MARVQPVIDIEHDRGSAIMSPSIPREPFSKSQRTLHAPELYEIRVAGHLSERWRARFEGLSLRHEPDGETVLSDRLDQAALHGALMKIRDLGVKLVSVNRVAPTEAY